MILKNCNFYNEDFIKKNADIEIKNGIITKMGKFKLHGKDMRQYTLVPGFVDIHIHGCNGGDTSDANVESLEKMSLSLSKHGVTSFCPTTMTLGRSQICDIVKLASSYENPDGAKIAGINLEGPFISREKKGAQNPNFIRKGTISEFEDIYNSANGKIKLITIAPETFNSEEFIKYASQKCTVSIGHSNATADECKKSIDNGISHVTHLFNAMSPLTHRDLGIVGTVLENEHVMCELICDGGHIDPTVLKYAFDFLGEDRAIVVSDSMRAADLGAGEYELGGQHVFVNNDGKYAVLSDGTIAASITNIHQEFKNLISYGIDKRVALKACTINPARAIKADDKIGSIAVGKCADLVFLDKELNVKEVYINGIRTKHRPY